jgi:hypothetical protein
MHNFFDGSCSDVWCCGVMLYIMVTGALLDLPLIDGMKSICSFLLLLLHFKASAVLLSACSCILQCTLQQLLGLPQAASAVCARLQASFPLATPRQPTASTACRT